MKLKLYILLVGVCVIGFNQPAFAQYKSWIVGDPANVTPSATGGIVLMGGGTDNDDAMKWMLQKSGGGDIVVIRASGGDGYNAYLYALASVNSVETILIDSRRVANLAEVAQKIRDAEALFIAGGNQADYVNYWKETLVEDAINYLINTKKVVIGGTSAGCAIQGRTYFDAINGTITSSTALANPYSSTLTLQRDNFLENSILSNTVTDTHYDNPDRRGRHITFLARMVKDWNIAARGIGVNEKTAVCIEPNGTARVFGDPALTNYAYFLQSFGGTPETCVSGSALTWNRNATAVKVYKIQGDKTGSKSFNLNDWRTATGGIWEDFYVVNGTLQVVSPAQAPGTDPNPTCATPISLNASSITATSAVLSWSSTSAPSYEVRYKETVASNWITLSSNTVSVSLNTLTPAKQYEFQVKGICSSTVSSNFSVSFIFSTLSNSISYCAATGQSSSYEWIDLVDIRNLYNLSGNNNGYGNFLNLSTDLERGQSYSIYLRPAFSGSSYTEYWRVWIDFNKNGSFDDVGELVYQGNSRNAISGTVRIPTNVNSGATRMRVAMRYNNYAASCGSFQYGEVEDYTVNIFGSGSLAKSISEREVSVEKNSVFDLYPNPASQRVTIHNSADKEYNVQIIDSKGTVLNSFNTSGSQRYSEISLSELKSGLYIVRIITESGTEVRKLSIEK